MPHRRHPSAARLPILLAAAADGLAACGSAPASEAGADEQVELVFANWISAEEPTIPAYEAMIEAFEAEHPNISVTTTSLPFNEIKNQLLISAAGGQPPDVAQIKEEWLPGFDALGATADIGGSLPPETLGDFEEGLLAASRSEEGTTAVPWAPSVVQLYYNTDLLKAAGYDGSPPQTWDEMIEMATAVAGTGTNAAGSQVYGIGISDKKLEGAGYFALPWVWNNGGELLDDDGNVVFDSPENVETFARIGALLNDGVAPKGVEIKDLRSLFAQGQLGFYFDIEAAIGIHAAASPEGAAFSERYDIAPVPGETGSPGRTFYTAHALTVFENSEHPEEAALLVDFLTGPEGIAVYNDNGGFKLPARTSAADIEFYGSDAAAPLEPFLTALPEATALPATNDQFTVAMEAIANAIARVELGEDPGAVVSSTAAELTEAYQD